MALGSCLKAWTRSGIRKKLKPEGEKEPRETEVRPPDEGQHHRWGWHLSNFMTVTEIQNKLRSFSHSGYSQTSFADATVIESAASKCQPLCRTMLPCASTMQRAPSVRRTRSVDLATETLRTADTNRHKSLSSP